MSLEEYRFKRDFENTPEPAGKLQRRRENRFVVQEHHASHLHFDFRLEISGVLKSWAIPKGPSMDPTDKRLAVQVEDHPVEYLNFEGEITEGNYGAGQVRVWDIGTFQMNTAVNSEKAYDEGKLSFKLNGKQLKGSFGLVRMRNRKNQWLLIKANEQYARTGWNLEMIIPEESRVSRSVGTAKSRSKRAGARKNSEKDREKATPSGKQRAGSTPISLSEFVANPTLHENAALEVDSYVVELTHLSKPYFPPAEISKGGLVRYYLEMADIILPYLSQRPLILKRFRNGIGKTYFYQHDLSGVLDYMKTTELQTEEGRSIDYGIINNRASLAYVTNLGTIEEHPWHSRLDDLHHPDWLVFDLDPERADWDTIRDVALALRDTLHGLELEGYPKTSGSRGLHIHVPIQTRYAYDTVASLAQRIALRVVQNNPNCAPVQRTLPKRKRGQVYIDHLQNAKGKTLAAPYSVRARPGAPVSTPLAWWELEKGVDPNQFDLHTIPNRVQKHGDLFASVLTNRQSLDYALKQST